MPKYTFHTSHFNHVEGSTYKCASVVEEAPDPETAYNLALPKFPEERGCSVGTQTSRCHMKKTFCKNCNCELFYHVDMGPPEFCHTCRWQLRIEYAK